MATQVTVEQNAIFSEIGDVELVYPVTSTGATVATSITINTNTNKFDTGLLKGFVIDYWTDPSAPPIVHKINRPALIDQISPYRVSHSLTYISVNKDSQIKMTTSPLTDSQAREYVQYGWVYHPSPANEIVETAVLPVMCQSPLAQLGDLIRGIELIRTNGLKYSGVPGSKKISRSKGGLFGIGVNFTLEDPDRYRSPNRKELAIENPVSNMLYVMSDGLGIPVLDDNVDSNYYEFPLGVLTAVPLGKFSVQIIVAFTQGRTNIQYGQQVYDTMEEAVLSIENENYTVAPAIVDSAIVLAAMVIKQGMSDTATQGEFYIKNFGKLGGNIG